ncbi:hypothetical protein [Arenibacterium sp. LLYu02]|uniref:hypothetical protein n=1 Tax=Arenibacterium sp. LLYu02 TaxID=3404132 RepID=UPI003B21FD09
MRAILSTLLLALGAVFGFLAYDQHLKWRACFNALGRCFDPGSGTVHLQQSGLVWLPLALLTLGGGIYTLWRAQAAKRSPRAKR